MNSVRGNVLIVDNDAETRDAAAGFLKDAGYRVWLAGDGEEALTILDREAAIDLLFTDIVIPGIDGYALAREARRRRPAVRVLYATRRGDCRRETNRDRGEVLGKPYGPAQLRAEVRLAFAEP